MTVGVGDRALPGWMAEVAAAIPRIEAGQLTSFAPSPGARPRAASVLILFGEGPRGPEVLLLERAARMRAHAGQVAFPGGRQDETDADAVAAALREAREETGLDPSGVDVVGVLPTLWLPVSDFMVTPVVAWWHTPIPVRAVDPAETASVHVISVADLLDPESRGRVRHPSGYVGPAFRVGDMLVWGFTAGVLARLFALLGWERPWDRSRCFDLPPRAVAGSAAEAPPAGLSTAEASGDGPPEQTAEGAVEGSG